MSAQSITLVKDQRQGGTTIATPVAAVGFGQSTWLFAGNLAYGANPAAFVNPDNTTSGSLRQTSPAGGKQQWLTSMAASFCASGELVLYDRLMHMGGLSGTVTTVQNLNGGSPATMSRTYSMPSGLANDGNEILVEMTVAVGATPTSIVANYVNSVGAAHTTLPVAFGGATRQSIARTIRLPLAVGDTGVTSVTSVQVSGSTGTAGNFAVVVAHRILELHCGGIFMPVAWTGINDGFREIASGACLYFAHFANSASSAGTVAMHAALNLVDF